tara:strand:- start:98 stop:1282 length:1185 start_codon:yes stop_codon:yes gene_type:complete
MKVFFSSILTSLLLFIFIDFFLGKKILDYLYSFETIKSPIEIKKRRLEIQKKEKSYRIKNSYFHHSLKPNIKTKSFWGNMEYNTCTNSQGFRTDCIKKKNKDNSFQIIFIGDSFTEGLGLEYEKTFVGLFDDYSEYSVLNMAVSSYSPIIYLEKIKYFLDKGVKIDSVIVFLDISDIDDETYYYEKCKNNSNVCDQKEIKNLKSNALDGIENKDDSSFPLFNFAKIKLKEIKRIIKPKNYIYRKEFKRSEWTYNNLEEYKRGLESSVKYMTELSNILNKKNINLSLAVYPHPATLIHDVKNSKHVKIWKSFCKNKCLNFINLFPIFFDEIKDNNQMEVINKYYIKNDIHFNQLGNKKIFDFLKNFEFGAPDRSRTHNLRSRNPALYPVEATGAT